jgi:hypothetical protein
MVGLTLLDSMILSFTSDSIKLLHFTTTDSNNEFIHRFNKISSLY